MNENEILQWLQEVQHPGKEDQNVVALGLVEKIHIADNAVHVTLGFPKRPDPLKNYLVGAVQACLYRHLPGGTEIRGGHRCEGARQTGVQRHRVQSGAVAGGEPHRGHRFRKGRRGQKHRHGEPCRGAGAPWLQGGPGRCRRLRPLHPHDDRNGGRHHRDGRRRREHQSLHSRGEVRREMALRGTRLPGRAGPHLARADGFHRPQADHPANRLGPAGLPPHRHASGNRRHPYLPHRRRAHERRRHRHHAPDSRPCRCAPRREHVPQSAGAETHHRPGGKHVLVHS